MLSKSATLFCMHVYSCVIVSLTEPINVHSCVIVSLTEPINVHSCVIVSLTEPINVYSCVIVSLTEPINVHSCVIVSLTEQLIEFHIAIQSIIWTFISVGGGYFADPHKLVLRYQYFLITQKTLLKIHFNFIT